MNIEYIRSFLETARWNSISKASEKLHLTHPALSKQLRAMEAYYGAALFHRSNAGVELTEAGKHLLERLQPLYQELSAIRSEMGQWNQQSIRHLTLGTLPTLASGYMPERVYAMEAAQLQLDLRVMNTSSELYSRLQSGELDAIVCERLPDGASSTWEHTLFSEPYVAIVYKEHPFSQRTSVSLAELSKEPFILHTLECRIRQTLTERMEQAGFGLSVKTEVGFNEFILGYVATGAGITVLPEMAARNLASASLAAVPIADEGMVRVIALTTTRTAADKGRLLAAYLKP